MRIFITFLLLFQAASSECKGQRRRISCPLDPSHTVFEDTLHKHLKKCNVAKKPKPSCYSAHINAGLVDYQPSDEEKLPLSAFSTERIDELVKKVERAYQGSFIKAKPLGDRSKLARHETKDLESSTNNNYYDLHNIFFLNCRALHRNQGRDPLSPFHG